MTRASTDQPTRRRPAPVATVAADPEVWERALELAGGDARRLEVRDGGRTVAVLNSPRP